jgi:hypothetical protein
VTRGQLLLLAGTLLATGCPAFAQIEDDLGRVLYPASFFAPYSPANAQQMIERVPGFAIDGGDTGVRGFAQAAGNVVINGQRPSSKSDSLQTILSRIPASRVLRIEVASGNQFGADYAGKPQVVNLVLSEEGGLAGTLEGRVVREFTGRILPRVLSSAIWRRGDSSLSASFNFQLFGGATDRGFDRLTDLDTDEELEYRVRATRNTEPWTVATLGWALEQAPDRSAHLNGKVSLDKWTMRQTSAVFAGGTNSRNDVYTEDHLWRSWELSGDVTRPLGDGAIKLNLVATHRHRRNDDALGRSSPATGPGGGFYQSFDDYRDERISRLAWSRSDLLGWSIELGGEGSFNRLKSDLDLYDVDPQGVRTPSAAPLIYHAVVTEYRGEAFLNAGRDLRPDLHLDLGLTYEASRLKVTGDAAARRTLKFLKPKISFDWTPGDWHAQFSIRRTVAQLQFEDFVSSASFTTNQVNRGNAELQPQRAWEILASADRKLLGEGRIKLELGYNAIQMVQDRVPIAGGGDSPGNLGDGTERKAKLSIDLPLKALVRGARLSVTGSYVATSVRDPYTLEDRRFSGNSSFAYSGNFRQDLGSFAWGLTLQGNTGSTFFRRTEIDTIQGVSPKLSAFAEYRPSGRTTFTLGGENLTNSVSKRLRTFYASDRAPPASANPVVPDSQEFRQRNNHLQLYLSIKHSFG